MDLSVIMWLFAAGLLAGVANTVAGGGSFISYPALIAIGVPPIAANVTSAVGLVSGYAGGSVAYRRELQDQGSRLRSTAVTVISGATVGAVLLLSTSASSFERIVPFLVLSSSALLALQPRIKALVLRRQRSSTSHGVPAVAHVGLFVAGVYGGYFGAGLGVFILVVLASLIADTLQRLNGLKTLLSLVIKCAGVAIFVFSGQVLWGYAFVLLLGGYGGGVLGARVSRMMSESLLRWSVITCGLCVGVVLLAASAK